LEDGSMRSAIKWAILENKLMMIRMPKAKQTGKGFSGGLVLGTDTAGRDELPGFFLHGGKKEARKARVQLTPGWQVGDG